MDQTIRLLELMGIRSEMRASVIAAVKATKGSADPQSVKRIEKLIPYDKFLMSMAAIIEEHFHDREIELLIRFFQSKLGVKLRTRKIEMDQRMADLSMKFGVDIAKALDEIDSQESA